MDLRTYYRNLRELAATLPDPAVVVSRATPDGGVAGRLTEAPRDVAARLIFHGFAELASDGDAAAFRAELLQRKGEEEARRAAARIQVNVVTEEQVRALRPKKDRS
jgi:hypothetical protein